MAWVEEQLVREYFEINGFRVGAIRARETVGRRRKGHPDYHLEILRSDVTSEGTAGFQLFTSEVGRISWARVRIEGWDAAGFTVRMLRNGKQLVEHLRKSVLKGVEPPEAEEAAGAESTGGRTGECFRRIWVLPGLPSTDPYREEAVGLLRERGVDHALTFRTILDNVSQNVDTTVGYERSPFLELIRLMKLFEMVSPPQMDLFQRGGLS